ncbi:winged helix-turn-helix domain-containing protein [Streptomyces sp. NBC_00243]|uniref:winged helix-turn-helix domain-containing protein n=1 Tax=Streptomyces sp. NBC_00243 TaxID=2975688 RepID=UPI002DDC1F44|nr:winged helix-turn-helix domain-containing protein [Streptomyces sp. NBC_00243]WRZ21567.1 winged helix-turn-helix domain-containing protein [Streptomyces sp. NBC_00243]
MDGARTGDGGGREVWRVAEALRARMADGAYPLGGQLPAQRELAHEFGVSRDTVQRALKDLIAEGWIESRQGSGSRVIKTQRVQSLTPKSPRSARTALGPIIGRAFEQPEVTLDVYTLTSETLDTHIRLQAERIRAREIAPQSIAVRMLLPSEDLDFPFPQAVDHPDDPRLRERLLAITGRHTSSLRNVLEALRVEGLVPSVRLEIRHVPLVPPYKLYLLNGTEALQGFYEVIERPIVLDGPEEVVALDVLGLGATLIHYLRDDDPDSTGSVFVTSSQAWFDSVLSLLAK